MATYKGNDLIVSDDSGALAASKSCTVNVSGETIEISSPDQGNWKEYIAGMKSWSASTTHLVKADGATGAPIKNLLLRVGKTYTLTFKMNGYSNDTFTGKAICKSFKVTATRGSLINCSLEFTGTGALS